MKKVMFFIIFMVWIISAIYLQAIDSSYLHEFKWKVIYKCYDDDCAWDWKLCNTICFNSDGFIYNEKETFRIGKWSTGSGIGFRIEFFSNGGNLSGIIFFNDYPSIGMEGQGFSFYWGKGKFVKIFMVRESRRK